jgi:HD-like signal output (HDOD) protein
MRMPGMDGATLLGHVRERYPAVARIVLSGHSEMKTAMRALPVAHRFLAKPCEASEVRAVIERVCFLQDLLSSAELRNVVGAIGELPSLSSVYMSLLEVVRKPDVSISQIAVIIEQDMAMAAKVLQLANSAYFGLARQVTSLQNAVSYLGIEVVKNLVLTAEVFRAFRPDPRLPHVFEEMQSQAQRSAVLAGRLPVDANLREIAVIAALLHDVGELILAAKAPEALLAVLERVEHSHCAQYEAEEEILGTSHAEIGAYLLGLWGIPHLAVEAIAHHHHPTRISHSGFDASIAVYVADLVSGTSAVRGGETEPPLSASDRSNLEKLHLLERLPEFRAVKRMDPCTGHGAASSQNP